MKMPKPDNMVYVKSDRFFNDPDGNRFFEDMGMDVTPVDAFGAVVPTSKNSDLKKTQANIRHRFQLDPFDVEQGGES